MNPIIFKLSTSEIICPTLFDALLYEDSPNKFSVTETIKSAVGARTIAYDEKTHHIFTVTAQYGETPPVTTENPRPRAKIISNTFVMMEFGK